MSDEKPAAAFILSLSAGIIILIGGLIYGMALSIAGALLLWIPFAGGAIAAFALLWLFIGVGSGAAVVYGAVMINSGKAEKIRTGSVLVLAFSLVSVVATGGFGLGTVLGAIGGILGLLWKPNEKKPEQQA